MKGIKITAILIALTGSLLTPMTAQDYGAILPMRERAKVINELLEDKIEHYLPKLMSDTGIDMWVVVSRE